jgi:hypothetical protein
MAPVVAPQAGGDNVFGSVQAAVLACKQMLCRALQMPCYSEGYFVDTRKAFAIDVPHREAAVIAAAMLLFISLLT